MLPLILPLITEHHENLLLAGDLNVHLDPTMDKKGGKINMATPYAGRLMEIFEEYNLVDIWRIMNPTTRRFTWRENTAYGIIQSRLDYIICPNSLTYDLKQCNIENSQYSDHNPITIEIYIRNENIRGKGSWKFNNSLLTDTDYVKKVKTLLGEYKERYKKASDHCLIWDTAKAEIRGITISHASSVNRKRKED